MDTRPPLARQILVAIGLLAAVALIAFLGSLASMSHVDGWYADVEKVAWNPPNWLFGPAWSVLYLVIAIAGWLIWRNGWRAGEPNEARNTLTLYTVQLVLNGLWTQAFFALYTAIGESAWWIAMVIISVLIIVVIVLAISTWKWSKAASLMMIPYVLWLIFASTLNAGVIALN